MTHNSANLQENEPELINQGWNLINVLLYYKIFFLVSKGPFNNNESQNSEGENWIR